MSDFSWIIAVLLGACSSFISNFGVALQKLEHIKRANAHGQTSALTRANSLGDLNRPRSSSSSSSSFSSSSSPTRSASVSAPPPVSASGPVALRRSSSSGSSAPPPSYFRGGLWLSGLLLVFLGALADFAALSFGPQSLVAPLGSLTLVSNAIYAPFLLNERVECRDWLSVALIIIGSALSVLFGAHTQGTFGVEQLFESFIQIAFVVYSLLIVIFVIAGLAVISYIEKIEKSYGKSSIAYSKYRNLHRFLYPAISGAIGAQSVLFAKTTIELFSATFSSEDNLFLHAQSYFIILGMFACIFFQIKYLNDALKRFDASYSVPIFQGHWICLSVISGMIFYKEYQQMDTTQVALFVIGVLIAIIGVATLKGVAHGEKKDKDEQNHNREANGVSDDLELNVNVNAADLNESPAVTPLSTAVATFEDDLDAEFAMTTAGTASTAASLVAAYKYIDRRISIFSSNNNTANSNAANSADSAVEMAALPAADSNSFTHSNSHSPRSNNTKASLIDVHSSSIDECKEIMIQTDGIVSAIHSASNTANIAGEHRSVDTHSVAGCGDAYHDDEHGTTPTFDDQGKAPLIAAMKILSDSHATSIGN